MTRRIPSVSSFALGLAAALGGCIAKTADGGAGPQTIRETGYLSCVASAGCEGTLCVTADGASVCEPLPEGCVGAAACDCAGTALCGDATCADVAGGLRCGDDSPDPGQDGGPVGPTDARPGVDPDRADVPDAREACVPTLDLGAGAVGAATIVVGQTDVATLVVRAGGCDRLFLEPLRLDGNPAFEVTFVDAQNTPLGTDDPDGDGTPGMAPGQTATLRITYAPAEAAHHRATLTVRANTLEGEHRLDLEGDAIKCTPAFVTPTEVFVAPGLPVALFAQYMPSLAEIETHEFVVTERPPGSVGQIGEEVLPGEGPAVLTPDDVSTPLAVFAADVPGVYTLALRSRGPTACEDDVVVPFYAPEMRGLAAVVEWAPTDGDDPPSTATLHLLAPGGGLGDPVLDCHAGNARPDWGVPGETGDDPELGLQHGAERGMAAAALLAPQDTAAAGAPYLLGVAIEAILPDANPEGPDEQPVGPALDVTVRIYQDGELVYDATVLVPELTTWIAAEIHVEAGVIRVVGLDVPI
jgi:hypothetical protein